MHDSIILLLPPLTCIAHILLQYDCTTICTIPPRPSFFVFHTLTWPLPDIVLLGDSCARTNHPFMAPSHLHCPHYCNTIACLLRNCMTYQIKVRRGIIFRDAQDGVRARHQVHDREQAQGGGHGRHGRPRSRNIRRPFRPTFGMSYTIQYW